MKNLAEFLQSWKKQNPEATWCGLRKVKEVTHYRSARDGRPESVHTGHSEGIMVEVLFQGQFAYAATPSLTPVAIEAALHRALTQARKASPFGVFSFSPEARPSFHGQYESPFGIAISKKPTPEVMHELVRISANIKKHDARIVRAEAFAQATETLIELYGSDGSQGTQNFSLMSVDFSATAQNGPEVQTRTDGGMRGRSLQGGWENLFSERTDGAARKVAEELELLSAPNCPEGKLDLLLMPDQMMLQIHESIGHPLEIDRILGDERNYAGWSFVKPSDFGTLQYGSSLMNAVFDPEVKGEYATYAFDDNGTPAKKEFLIREGKLLRGLGGRESQLRSGLPGVANSRASNWNRAPIDRMANLNIEPGRSTLEEMISQVEDGVLMESNRSWSIDDYRNKFQFGCEYGKRIQNGKITGTVKNPNYRGITVPFWNALKAVGRADTLGTYGTPNCGKGEPNQAIRVGHRSPPCLFKGIEVFGGGN